MDDFGALYSRYKKETQYVLYYLTNTTNAILRSLPRQDEDNDLALNTSGQVRVSSLVPMSNLLKKHKTSVPYIIIQFLKSVIHHRGEAHKKFLKMVAENPDPEMERSNDSHKVFIRILGQVLEILSGLSPGSSATADATADTEMDTDPQTMSNRFNALFAAAENGVGESDGESDDPEDTTLPGRPAARNRPKYRKKSGKKNCKGRHQKRQGQSFGGTKSSLPDVPMESYRIIEDFRSQGPGGPGLMTDYFLLTRGMFQSMAQFRCDVQELWREVAYDGLNTAVAGGTSNAAIALVRKITSSIFAEFPGNEAYETLWNTITRGDPERIAPSFAISAKLTLPGRSEPVIHKIALNIREHFLYYTYSNLCDFIKDWQLNRCGKPTKRMQAELKGWRPDFDLAGATDEERRRWRRVYTINWLYDMVNVYVAVSHERQTSGTEQAQRERLAEQRRLARQQNLLSEHCTTEIDQTWPRLFGLDEFAGFITGLVRQYTGTNTLLRILPEHVFQLQIIVDSFTVSRGWSNFGFTGQTVIPPPKDFTPRRDEGAFLDRSQKLNMGFIRSASLLQQTFSADSNRYEDFSRLWQLIPIIDRVKLHMMNWLGESKCMSEPSATPPSRFSETNPNGLWEYSPFLCGVGLLECLELAHAVGTGLMDKCPEVTLLVHLHNKLVCKGYLESPSCLWMRLTKIYRREFYKDGVIPTSDFDKALQTHLGEQIYKSPVWRRSILRKQHTKVLGRSSINVKTNLFFREKPVARVLREAEWDLEAMASGELSIFSAIAYMRMQRANKQGPPRNLIEEGDQLILRRARELERVFPVMKEAFELPSSSSNLVRRVPMLSPSQVKGAEVERLLVGGSVDYGPHDDPCGLLMVRADLENTIQGDNPTLGVSYLSLVSLAIVTLLKMETTLQDQDDATWKEACTFGIDDRRFAFDMRYKLLFGALGNGDPECLSTMAQMLEELHYSFDTLTYWYMRTKETEEANGEPHEHAQHSGHAPSVPDLGDENRGPVHVRFIRK